MLQVTRHSNARSFLDRAEAWLMRTEVENNLILGIAAALARKPPAKTSPYFATLDAGSETVGCAVRTPPHKLLITRCGRPEAMAKLAADALNVYPELAAALGPEPEIGSFAAVWADIAGRRVVRGMRQRLHEIRRIERLPNAAAGGLRPARAADLDLLIPWIAGFIEQAPAVQEDPAALARSRLKAGSLFVWDAGGPVSMASWSGETPNGVRVNLVFTPRELRSRGYATACVAALTERLLAEGKRYCCLFTNLANPISNRIYQRIGYRAVCDITDVELG